METAATMMKELNQHHKDTRDIVFCSDCDKAFSTHTSLDKHMYVHKDMDYVSDQCGQSFPFKSRLKQHKITHRKVLHGKELQPIVQEHW